MNDDRGVTEPPQHPPRREYERPSPATVIGRRAARLAYRALTPLTTLERRLLARGWLPRGALPLPSFLGIGAVKSGTTWLHHNLAAHPDVFMPNPKELHYLDDRFYRSVRWYSRHFREADAPVCGEITPSYGSIPAERVAAVAELLPDLRLILILRNPIDRTWSHTVMKVVTERNRDFTTVPTTELAAYFDNPHVRRCSDYEAIIAAWRAHFDPDQLLVLSYDSIRADPRGLMETVFDFVGVDAPQDWSAFPVDLVINPGLRAEQSRAPRPDRLPDELRAQLTDRYRGPIERLAADLGPPFDQWTEDAREV